ncbi:hypothetical protein RintRC_3634 [Richelia intracellularis]|nr:hypothetical protein RintRC_3634 [Richelia intracellularis]
MSRPFKIENTQSEEELKNCYRQPGWETRKKNYRCCGG